MFLSLSRRVSNLVGNANDALVDEENAGSDVSVVFHHVKMETDTSQIPPIQNCLLDMMTPRAADKNMADETERIKCKVQLQPNVAKDMETLEERESALIVALERLQNRYADIEKEQVALVKRVPAEREASDAGREQNAEARERFETEKRVLKAQIAEKRKMLTNTLHSLNALRTASQKKAENSSIRSVTLQVIEGEWCMGKSSHRLAKVSLKGMQHTQINDIQRGVPVEHIFRITFFQIENLLLAGKGNDQYRQVLGPLVDKDRDLEKRTAEDFEEDGTAMVAVIVEQLAQKEEVSNQVVYKSMSVKLYPLNIQITEDLYNCLYAFVFPGDWSQDGSNAWVHGTFHNLPVFVQEYVQNREFYRLPVTSCRPKEHPLGPRAESIQRHHSLYGNRELSGTMSSRNLSGSAQTAGLEADNSFPPRTGATVGSGQKETRELEQLKIRARDNKEFQQVDVCCCHNEHDLAVSINYKGRKGSTFPDINALVIEVPDVRFPKDDRPLVCTWRELYDDWLSEVKWPIIKQATGNMWSKVMIFFS